MAEPAIQPRGVSVPMPNGSTVWTDLMTPEEACVYLRLKKSPKQADTTLRYYANLGMLRATSIGGQNRYTVKDLDDFLRRQQARIQ